MTREMSSASEIKAELKGGEITSLVSADGIQINK